MCGIRHSSNAQTIEDKHKFSIRNLQLLSVFSSTTNVRIPMAWMTTIISQVVRTRLSNSPKWTHDKEKADNTIKLNKFPSQSYKHIHPIQSHKLIVLRHSITDIFLYNFFV